MTKSTGTGRGGYRKGAKRPLKEPSQKRQQYWVWLRASTIANFEAAVGGRKKATKRIEEWVEAYTVAPGASDRLFAQSPILLKTIRHLEAEPEPNEELLDELFSLLVVSNLDLSDSDKAKFWIV